MSQPFAGTVEGVQAAASAARNFHARKSTKTWIQETARVRRDTNLDSQANGVNPGQATKIVTGLTRFATMMCVVIAFVKVGVYLKSGAACVKTSALDSMGDLIANCITLYTGCKMSQIDLQRYPIGQTRFESIGVLVFSTLMAAMMFGNALGNIEALSEVAEKDREETIMDFWKTMFGEIHDQDGAQTFTGYEAGFHQFKAAVEGTTEKLTPILQQVIAAVDFDAATEAIKETVNEAAEVASPALKYDTLMFQSLFLMCCATYKFLLWLFCILYAIPRTGSTVLVALANDKRNDFVATTFVVISSLLAYYCADEISSFMDPDKVDPLCSLILSCVIICTWCCLILEQVTILSSSAVEPSVLNHVCMLTNNCIKDSGNQFDSECKAYYSSTKQTIEIDLIVIDPHLPFQQVNDAMGRVKQQMDELDNIERTIVVPRQA